jgi:hypothetical protein
MFSATWLSATALPRRSGATTSPIYACRAGPRKENVTPITNEATARIGSVSRPATSSAPTRPRLRPITICVTSSTTRFEMRSASTPPKGDSTSIAIPWPNITVPTARLLPVSSKATTLWAVIDIMKPTKEIAEPIQSTRKSRRASAAKVGPSQRTIPPRPARRGDAAVGVSSTCDVIDA